MFSNPNTNRERVRTKGTKRSAEEARLEDSALSNSSVKIARVLPPVPVFGPLPAPVEFGPMTYDAYTDLVVAEMNAKRNRKDLDKAAEKKAKAEQKKAQQEQRAEEKLYLQAFKEVVREKKQEKRAQTKVIKFVAVADNAWTQRIAKTKAWLRAEKLPVHRYVTCPAHHML